jgi:hypothetical protein
LFCCCFVGLVSELSEELTAEEKTVDPSLLSRCYGYNEPERRSGGFVMTAAAGVSATKTSKTRKTIDVTKTS